MDFAQPRSTLTAASDLLAAAAHLHVQLRRLTGRVTDTEWMPPTLITPAPWFTSRVKKPKPMATPPCLKLPNGSTHWYLSRRQPNLSADSPRPLTWVPRPLQRCRQRLPH